MQSAAAPNELPRVLTARHAISIVVGIVIGSGIFLVPREMMAATGRVSVVYAVWIIGGLLSLFGAMSYAEVAALHPRSLRRPPRLPLHLDLGHHRQARVHRHHRRRPYARARQFLRAQLSFAA